MTTTDQHTTHEQLRRRGRIAAATALAAGAIVAGTLGQTAPANANVDYYVALSYSLERKFPGVAHNHTDAEQARIASLKACDSGVGSHCVWYGTFKNECAALAFLGEAWATGAGPNLATAKQNALAQLPGGQIGASGCARSLRKDGDTFPVPTHTMVPNAPQ
jgi:hypothetical protein